MREQHDGLPHDQGRYYVCGSQPYRRGMGCGPGVYVPQGEVEAEVVQGLEALLGVCTDPQGFTRQVNEELRRMWEGSVGCDADAPRKIEAIDAKIANVRQAIEDGLADAGWANARLGELSAERAALEGTRGRLGKAPQVDAKTAMAYRRDFGRLMAHGEPADRKRIVRAWVEELKLAPERWEVEITYRIPEPVMHSVVARAGFEPATSRL